MLETARLGDLALWRQPLGHVRHWRWFCRLCRLGYGQADVFRTRRKRLDLGKEFIRSVRTVEAEAHQTAVVRTEVHGVEGRARLLVGRQVVDRVLPQGEARATLRQQDLDAALASGARLPAVQNHHGNPRVAEFPGRGSARAVDMDMGQVTWSKISKMLSDNQVEN